VLATALSAVAILFAAPATASAAVYVVDTTADPTPDPNLCGAGTCTLREAVQQAGPADSITVPAGTYVLSSIGELSLVGDTLNGAGARSTIIDANNQDRVMSATDSGGTASTISGMTVRGGVSAADGGGIDMDGTVAINNSHIVGNAAPNGGGIYLSGSGGAVLTMVGSTVAGNTASTSSGTQGGGIATNGEGHTITLINSTVTGNVARDVGPNDALGGGIYAGINSALTLSNVTVASNEAAGGGGGLYVATGASTTLANTIVADNSGAACAGPGTVAATSHHNLVTDGSCALTGPGNLQGVAAGLGGLANNGGPTDTRALGATSPAINAGSGCGTSDQRGIARPQGAACDIGAFEYVAPTLTLITAVTNNDGGEEGPADFSVHVRDGANAEVAGSPQAGSATGTTYTLAPGTFTVSADGPNLYTVAIGGACSTTGAVSLGENQTATCTITANDRQPRAGREVGAIPARGTVRIKKPGGKFQVLRESDMLPNGTIVDTLKGRITLIAPANKKGKETKADFYDGVFKISQSKGSKPTTTLTLTEKLTCAKAGSASTAAKKKRKRRLWGDGEGKFRTKGKHSAATVVGTKWLVEDRCTSTLTRVVRGKVSVRDFVKRKTVTVKRGKRYIARAEN
jgi:CSLREA domain-containing protein